MFSVIRSTFYPFFVMGSHILGEYIRKWLSRSSSKTLQRFFKSPEIFDAISKYPQITSEYFLFDEQKATKSSVCCNLPLFTESHYFFLLDSPKFTLEPKLPSRNPTAGFPVTLTWNVSGIPKPEVTWKNPSGENVSSDDPRFLLSEGKLTITSLEEKDVGMWTLEATNPLQTTTTNVVFDIIYGK